MNCTVLDHSSPHFPVPQPLTKVPHPVPPLNLPGFVLGEHRLRNMNLCLSIGNNTDTRQLSLAKPHWGMMVEIAHVL